ncbi:MAG TPA: serine hydrolase [Tepidiformaceae bacterium]|nr:serine hydrolase [Tepidiformaceae bacterium]
MQLRAALGSSRDGGWKVAFALSLCAAAFAALALVVALIGSFDDPPPPAEAHSDVALADGSGVPAPSPTATPSASATPVRTPTATRTPRPARTVTPVQPFGRSLTLVEDPDLANAIEDALGDEADHFSVVVVRPSDGRAALVDPDRVFYAASLFKLAVLYEAGLRLSSGVILLDDPLHLSDEELAEDLGTADELELDEEGNLPLGDALEAMVTVSDNATAVALLHLFGSYNVDLTLRALGIETLSVNTRELPATARDVARLMDAIVAGEGLDAASHELLLGLLSRQTVRGGIPSGLPDDVLSGNKTGTWEHITHDVAYVDAPSGTYIIAVLSDTDRDWDRIAEVSEAVYEALAVR